jgi:hypothetical protein
MRGHDIRIEENSSAFKIPTLKVEMSQAITPTTGNVIFIKIYW